MIKEKTTQYQELLEDIRHLYRQKYGLGLDDEILYLIIRINELQVDLKKEIKGVQKVAFRRGIDYFWHGVGKTFGNLFIGVALIILSICFLNQKRDKNQYSVIQLKGSKLILLKNYNYLGDTTIDITTAKSRKKLN